MNHQGPSAKHLQDVTIQSDPPYNADSSDKEFSVLVKRIPGT